MREKELKGVIQIIGIVEICSGEFDGNQPGRALSIAVYFRAK